MLVREKAGWVKGLKDNWREQYIGEVQADKGLVMRMGGKKK